MTSPENKGRRINIKPRNIVVISALLASGAGTAVIAQHPETILQLFASSSPLNDESATITPTPFQPLAPTLTQAPTPIQPIIPNLSNYSENTQENDPFIIDGIDFDESVPILFDISLREIPNYTIPLRVLPSLNRANQSCRFGSGESCTSITLNGEIVVDIHTGYIRGNPQDAESLRHFIEGTNTWQEEDESWRVEAVRSLTEIQEKLDMLINSQVTSISQGERVSDRGQIEFAVRIPPNLIGIITSTDDLLTIASVLDPRISDVRREASQNGSRIVVLNFCGWRIPGEDAPNGTSEATWSRYLVGISVPNS